MTSPSSYLRMQAKRQKKILIALSPGEHAQLVEIAKREGLSTSAYTTWIIQKTIRHWVATTPTADAATSNLRDTD
jgi:hypothetical protein